MIIINYYENIQRVLDYIEENLKNDIDNSKLASLAGYSEYHFLRIFRETVHLTPANYIRKRRISEIVRHMELEERPISDIAFEYGFNSKENFVRAFKAEHHILPTEFKTTKNSLKLYDKIQPLPVFEVRAELKIIEPFRLVAYKSDESFPTNFWNKYNTKHWSKKLSGGAVVEDFGACIWNFSDNKLDYYIGICEEMAHGDLSNTVTLSIAGGLYAIFTTPKTTHFDFINMVHRTWDYIAKIWLPQNGYCRTGGFELESYIESSRSFSEKIWIPIRKIKEINYKKENDYEKTNH